MKLCDLHTHVLPGIDDGAQNMEQALQMLQNAVASEVAYLVATPHFDVSQCPASQLLDRMEAQFQKLQEAAASIPVELALGAEVRISPELMAQLDILRLPTLGGGQYLLTEFPRFMPQEQFVPVLEKLLRRDYIPLIAHPERYAAVNENPWIVEQWLDMGCHIQITGSSMQGNYGRTAQRTADELLRKDFVACVASDAHGLNERTNYLMGSYDHLTVQFSRQYAQCLLHTNPLRIWRNETL